MCQSIETHNQDLTNNPEDFESARQLVEENELLKNDPRTLKMLENQGYTMIDGRDTVIDIGNYLASRLKVICIYLYIKFNKLIR